MDLHRLEVFCKVVDLQSFTKAADASFLTQPTVSEHVRMLEEMVGEKLLDRFGREVLPTQAGKILYKYARQMIQIRNEALQALDRYKGVLSGHLTIGASTIPGTYVLPALIGSFKASYPTIQITLKISSSGQIVERILDGALEAGVIGAKWTDRRIELEEAFADELVLAVPPGHPWASLPSLPLETLAGEPFILRERGSGTRIVAFKALEAAGFDPSRLHPMAEMGSTEAVRQGIKAGIGVSILSAQAVVEDVEHKKLVMVPIEGVQIHRPFYLAQRKSRQSSPLCAAFLEHLRKNA